MEYSDVQNYADLYDLRGDQQIGTQLVTTYKELLEPSAGGR
jgi:hypothetical protein